MGDASISKLIRIDDFEDYMSTVAVFFVLEKLAFLFLLHSKDLARMLHINSVK